MSKSRKHLQQELDAFPLPDSTNCVARVIELRGDNQCLVEIESGTKVLTQIPSKFRKIVWIKKGNYVLIDAVDNISEYKLKGLVQSVLQPNQIEYINKMKLWPKYFESALKVTADAVASTAVTEEQEECSRVGENVDEESDSDDSLDKVWGNSNRR